MSFLFGSKAKRHLLQLVLDSLPVALICQDVRDGYKTVIWNKKCHELWGVPKAEAIGKNEFDFLPHEVAERSRSQAEEIVAGRKPVFVPEEQITPVKGEKFWNRSWKIPMYDDKGNPTHLLIINQDITDIKRFEKEKHDREKQLESISNNAPAVFYQFRRDADGSYSMPYISRRCFDYFGISDQEIMQDVYALLRRIHEDDFAVFEATMERTISQVSPWRWEGRFRHADGRVIWIKGASEPNPNDDGSIIWDGLLVDCTAQREAEALIRKQEDQLSCASKLAALGEMAGGVAHEINTPLSTILMSAERIREVVSSSVPDLSEILELAEDVEKTSARIAKIISGFRSVARDAKKDPLDQVNTVAIVDEMLSLCAPRFKHGGVSVDFERPARAVMAPCRAAEIGQVILNLLNNAFDAVAASKNPWIRVRMEEDNGEVRILVSDSGNGLPDEVKEKIFQPFFTTKGPGKGTGLGLSISLGIMNEHSGRLSLDESSLHTTFVVGILKAKDTLIAA